jgi:outer membrane protein OmpA-like peptidoglycan-associated protein
MLTHITVGGDDLRQLAHARAEAARQKLVSGGVASERIFVVESPELAAQHKDKARDTRVDFTVR